jgi:transposase-like protein
MNHQTKEYQAPYRTGLGSLFATYAREPHSSLQVVCPFCQSEDVKLAALDQAVTIVDGGEAYQCCDCGSLFVAIADGQ